MSRTIIDGEILRIIQHPGQGFFSCCTIHLQRILDYYNEKQKLPKQVDSSKQFMFYKTPQNWNEDIKHEYFELYECGIRSVTEDIHAYSEGRHRSPEEYDKPPIIPDYNYSLPIKTTHLQQEEQYSDYRWLNYTVLRPFIQTYFSPSVQTKQLIEHILSKYQIDLSNTCVLFYRGNDKATEVQLPSYDQYVNNARALLKINPELRFLVQSDETEFLDTMKEAFPNNHVIFYDEIRHIPKCLTTVDKLLRYQNSVMSKLFVSIVYVMSRCEYVICNSGNCSYWIALFRGHCHNLIQLLEPTVPVVPKTP